MESAENDKEKKEILNKYKALLRACKPTITRSDKRQIRLAFEMASEAHKNMRRRSGEPYILHPLAVALIVAKEIGLGTTSIMCALLHDVVEDTDITLEDLEHEFGKKVAQIVDGLTKISGVFDNTSSLQAENFRKMLLTMADDVRVILIKIADRLHNMRTLESMPRDKQLKISSETSYLYAPLAHRLGLYALKSELEDLSMKYTEQGTYKTIARKLAETKDNRGKFIKSFIAPIKEKLEEDGIQFKIFGRPKSIHSIWNKMKKKGVPFEEVYDLFAVRIVIDTIPAKEKAECWKVYSIITDSYQPSPDRLRDWISTPKANAYEALHTTVMGPSGSWVEIQIRTVRMDEIAEKGFAAHWKYKEQKANHDNSLEDWIGKIREMLSNPDGNALDFVDDFKMNLFTDEIFIFTPKGDLKKLPANSTILDFAYEIHTDIGSSCIGAKVNHKLVPISFKLSNGDQVEIITSNKQKPKEDWIQLVATARAKSKIKSSLKEELKRIATDGKEILERKLNNLKIDSSVESLNKLTHFFHLPNIQDLYYRVGKGRVDTKELRVFQESEKVVKDNTPERINKAKVQKYVKNKKDEQADHLVIGDGLAKVDYKMAPCCNPIPGDDVFGFITINEGIKIHRTNCPNAEKLMSNFGYRVVKAHWTNPKIVDFLAGLKITGIDDVGVINNITKVISNDFSVNMRSITVESNDGIFEGLIMVYVNDTKHLDELKKKLQNVNGIMSITRFESQQSKN
ncbi:MAG: guanosine-3',5'-bis(diphosphate) 3'-pyrophosphohydrolase [Sphingobacteriales bacterium]|jgi:guanosine-3',5'-bis(diphosphate) 3'-pyrophosphohydrolase